MYNYQASLKSFTLVVVFIAIVRVTPTYAIELLSDNELQNNFTSLTYTKKVNRKPCKTNEHEKILRKDECKQEFIGTVNTNSKNSNTNKKKNNTQLKQTSSTNDNSSNNTLNAVTTGSNDILSQLNDDSDLSTLDFSTIPAISDSSNINNEWLDKDVNKIQNNTSVMPIVINVDILKGSETKTDDIKHSTVSDYFYRDVYGGINNGVDIEIPSITSSFTEILIQAK